MTAASREVRDLADAIREALTVPVADMRDPGGPIAEETLMSKRAALVRGVLDGFLAQDEDARDVAVAARTIRKVTAETPVTYAVRHKGPGQKRDLPC